MAPTPHYSNEVSLFESFELELNTYAGNVVTTESMMSKAFCDVFLLAKRRWKMRSTASSLFSSTMAWAALGMMAARNRERGGALPLVSHRVGVSTSSKRALKSPGICAVGLSSKRSEKIWKTKGMNSDTSSVRINANGSHRRLIRST